MEHDNKATYKALLSVLALMLMVLYSRSGGSHARRDETVTETSNANFVIVSVGAFHAEIVWENGE
jgi:hypothetical protein